MVIPRHTFAFVLLLLWFFTVFPVLSLAHLLSLVHPLTAAAQDSTTSQDSSLRTFSALPVIEFGVPGKPPSRNITTQTEYWIDTTQTMTIERLLRYDRNHTQLFRRAVKPRMHLGNYNGVLWLKLSLARLPTNNQLQNLIDSVRINPSVQTKLAEVLQPWVLSLRNRSVDSVMLYITNGEIVLHADTVGFSVPYRRWRVPSTEIAFPLLITSGSIATCYVRMYNKGILYYTLNLQQQHQYVIDEFDFKLPYLLFYGVALFAFVFSLLSWLITRSRYYGLYILYVIFLVLVTGFDTGLSYQAFEMETPFLYNRLCMLFWISSLVSGVVFVWTFVLEQPTIKIPWFLQWSAWVFFASCVVAIVAEFVDARGLALNVLYYGYLILAVPTTLAMSFLAWRGGYHPALYLFVSRLIVELGIGANSLAALGILSYSSIWISQLSLLVPAVEMMLMGLALADRITVLQRAKQVAERKALEGELYRLQNEELSAANVEITRQQNELHQQAVEIQEMNTQVTLLNDSLQQQNDELAEANHEKSEILGIVAHDLKNPIGGVRGMAELIEQGYVADREKTVGVARQIMSTADRMLELVKKLLDINMLESGGMQMNFYAFDILPMVDMIIEQYTTPAAAKHITFLVDSQAKQTIIFANEQAVMQVLDNLVSNAVKYSPLGKNISVRIKEGSVRTGNNEPHTHSPSSFLRVEVQDEGPGCTEEDMAKLFGKFARLSAQPTGGEHSTGLGLSIVKKMVEVMQGRVWCESEFGNGATFIVELPTFGRS